MASILHQQAADRCRDKVSRDGETGPGPCDRLKETDIILPFTHHLGSHQLSIETSSLEAGRFRSSIEVGDRAKLV